MLIEIDNEQARKILVKILTEDYAYIMDGTFSEECKRFLPAFEQLFEFYLSASERATFMRHLTPDERKELK